MRLIEPASAHLTIAMKNFFTVATTMLVAATYVAADPPEYRIELLGSATIIADINASGEAVGEDSPPLSGAIRAFVAGPMHPHELLPLPEGYTRSRANGINDAGVIVGGVSTNMGFPNEHGDAAVWTPDGNGGYDVEVLGHLPGHTGSVATAINNRGDIVGSSIFNNSGFGPSVWFNSPEGILDFETTLNGPDMPQDVNDNGLVVGFRFRTLDLDTLQSAGLPPGQLAGTAVMAANNHDELAGYAANTSQNRRFAVRHTPELGWEQLGGIVAAQANWAAWDINDRGDAVIPFAVHFDEHGLVNFSDLLAADQGNWDFCNCAGAAINNAGQIAVIAEDLDTFEVGVAMLTPIIAGDFNGDAQMNGTDIDALVAEIAIGANTESFDLTGDSLVNLDDLDWWLVAAGNMNLPAGNPYLAGDANLDGAVDAADFNAWNAHKFSALASWTAGDFNANGMIDGEDLLIWNANKYTTADNGGSVPEPAMPLGWVLLAISAARGASRSDNCREQVPTTPTTRIPNNSDITWQQQPGRGNVTSCRNTIAKPGAGKVSNDRASVLSNAYC